MQQPPEIEGEFRVVSGETARLAGPQPFLGPNATLSGFLGAICMGCTLIAPHPGSAGRHKWAARLIFICFFLLIALGRAVFGPV